MDSPRILPRPHTALPTALLAPAIALLPPAPAAAQESPGPQPSPQVTLDGSSCTANWLGKAGLVYFLETSNDLEVWNYQPIRIQGTGAPASHTFDTGGTKSLFVRLRCTTNLTGDVDSDGVADLDEIRGGGTMTDPFRFSSDGSGRSDYFSDRDGGGVADGWEIQHFGDAGAAAPRDDGDGDGLDNAAESLLGTDPNLPDSDGDTLSRWCTGQLSPPMRR